MGRLAADAARAAGLTRRSLLTEASDAAAIGMAMAAVARGQTEEQVLQEAQLAASGNAPTPELPSPSTGRHHRPSE